MAHDAVDTNVRSRRLNGAAAIDKTEQNKSNGNGVTSTTSPDSSAEVNHTSKNGSQLNANNNYENGRKEETRNGVAASPATADNHLSCMRGVLHDNAPFIPQIRWPDLIAQIFLHVGALYGLLFQFYSIKFYTLIWCKLTSHTRIPFEWMTSNGEFIANTKCTRQTVTAAAYKFVYSKLWTLKIKSI